MSGLTFQRPEILWALPLVVLLILGWRIVRRPRYATLGIHTLIEAPAYRASPLRRAPLALAAGVTAVIALALADPVVPYSEQRIQSRGVDIAVVFDLSASMQEPMTATANAPTRPSRLTVTKQALSGFIARRPDDRIGLLVFSDNAYVLSPLTMDHASLQHQVAMIDAKTIEGEGMTAIGEGVALGAALLARQAPVGEPRDGVVVILTDGENTAGREPIPAVLEAFKAGHQVYLVAVDFPEEVKRRPEVVRLVQTVQSKDGRYFSADNAGELAEAAQAIDSLERGVLTSTRYVRNVPAFEFFASLAVVLLCATFLLASLPYFIDVT